VAHLVRGAIEPIVSRPHDGRIPQPPVDGVTGAAMPSLASHRFAYTFPSIERGAAGQLALAWQAGTQPFNAEFELDTSPSLHLIRSLAGAFSADECRRIAALGSARPKMDGTTDDHRERYRASEVAWIEPAADAHWLYHKLAVLFSDVNGHYGFELLGLLDPLQYTVYGAGQHFDWHIDVGGGAASLRKLSLTVQLSDGGDYEGGDLEFHDEVDRRQQRALGTATVFPSFLAHRVSPVVSGVRRSLVAWACGPSFR
jgi:PKHD-type hydroxylase